MALRLAALSLRFGFAGAAWTFLIAAHLSFAPLRSFCWLVRLTRALLARSVLSHHLQLLEARDHDAEVATGSV
jgi:DNA-binding HxlR family transcriptional regulator